MRAVRFRCIAALLGAGALLSTTPVSALVQMAGDGNGNTTAPADDFGFANVGAMGNGLTGVYLGNGWVLTASHVGPTSITLAGQSYPLVPGSWVAIQHSPGVQADLGMERISGSPPLPTLIISAFAPIVGENVSMVGNGWARQASQTCWDASWVEISCAGSPAHRGFEPLLGSLPGPRWGRNAISMAGFDVPLAGMTTRAFEVTYDLVGLPEEAQAVVGDSGGGVFVKRSTQWQLAGVLFAINVFEGQPGSTAVFGNHTYAADLSHYRSQIVSIMAPTEVPALPWPGIALGGGLLAGLARGALSGRRRSRS